MANVIKLSNICKHYVNNDQILKVFDSADFELKAAEMVALVAPSGTGKSTMLHIAGLLEQPTSGEIFIHGEAVSHLSNNEKTKLRGREIGFVYQGNYLLPEFTALENIMMPLLIAGNSKEVAEGRAIKLLKYLKISDKIHSRPAEMSGGQKQRVAIARSIANAPSMIFADEPTGNLDPKTAQIVFNIFTSLVRDVGISAIIATHNYSLAKQMDRIITISESKIVEL